jgi:hypothetical protein
MKSYDEMYDVMVKIKEVSTGEVRSLQFQLPMYGSGEPSIFPWEDGNYGCDCNREIFFKDAGGEKVPMTGERCGHGKYLVKIEDYSGNILYDEFEK